MIIPVSKSTIQIKIYWTELNWIRPSATWTFLSRNILCTVAATLRQGFVYTSTQCSLIILGNVLHFLNTNVCWTMRLAGLILTPQQLILTLLQSHYMCLCFFFLERNSWKAQAVLIMWQYSRFKFLFHIHTRLHTAYNLQWNIYLTPYQVCNLFLYSS